jgi:hypothetical protein
VADVPDALPALKEWAAIVRALVAGEQIIDVRKGGLREPGRRFGLPATRCWLVPTTEHERPELLKPAYRRWAERPESAGDAGAWVHVPGWAEIVGVATVTDPEVLEALDPRVIWTREYVASRFAWKRREPLWVLALRVHRLDQPIPIPWDERYRACASWVQVAELPPDPAALPSVPAVTDTAFAARLAGLAEALPGGFRPPEPDGPPQP